MTEDRVRSARAAAERPLDGYVLEGLANGPDSLLLPSVERIAQLVRDTLVGADREVYAAVAESWSVHTSFERGFV